MRSDKNQNIGLLNMYIHVKSHENNLKDNRMDRNELNSQNWIFKLRNE